MKTNSTIGKQLLAAFALIAVVLSSCSKDDENPTKDISGKYTLTSATLIDGDLSNSSSTDLVILNGSTDPNTDPPYTATIPAGANGVQGTTYFVNAILAGAAPCTDQNPANWMYDIDLQNGGTLAFDCTSEDISETLGTWTLSNNTSLTLAIQSSTLGNLNVTINNLEITDTTISGTVESFPMVKDATASVSLDNLQFISFEIVITKVQ